MSAGLTCELSVTFKPMVSSSSVKFIVIIVIAPTCERRMYERNELLEMFLFSDQRRFGGRSKVPVTNWTLFHSSHLLHQEVQRKRTTQSITLTLPIVLVTFTYKLEFYRTCNSLLHHIKLISYIVLTCQLFCHFNIFYFNRFRRYLC